MHTTTTTREGGKLLQIGVALLLFCSVEGFAIPFLRVPRLGLSVHTLAALEGVLLVAFGLMWPKLDLKPMQARVAWWSFVYSTFATLVPYVLAAVWGAGSSTMPLAAGAARGTPAQEMIIKVIVYTAAPTVLVALALILWGLRTAGRGEHRAKVDGRPTHVPPN